MSESDLGYQPGGSALDAPDPMALISAAFGGMVQAGPLEAAGGAGLVLGAEEGAAMAGTPPSGDLRNAYSQWVTQTIRQVPLPTQQVPLSAGAGVLNEPSQYGPPTLFYWSVRRITCWGFTAGTVTGYLDSVNGEAVAPFAQAGVFTFGKGELLINPQSWLVFQAAGITGTVAVAGRADQFPVSHLRYYLG